MTIKQECVRKTCVFTLLGKTYPPRYGLHIKFLNALRRRGYRVLAITEHGYPEGLKDGNVEYYPQIGNGVGVAYRQGLRLALERCEYAAYSEPEKVSYVPEIWKTIRPLIRGNADLVVPKRTQASLRSYPIVQRQTETIGNEFFAHLVGSELDVFFGPGSIASGESREIPLPEHTCRCNWTLSFKNARGLTRIPRIHQGADRGREGIGQALHPDQVPELSHRGGAS